MGINFTQRVQRLLKADAHGLIESLEDRALLLKQHLREAELAVQHKQARHGALAEEERRLQDDARRLEEAQRNLDEDVRLALAGEREDLARFAIRKLLPTRGEIASLRARVNEIGEERDRLGRTLEQQEAELEELRARVRAQLAENARRVGDDVPRLDPAVAEEEVEMELLRRMRAAGGES